MMDLKGGTIRTNLTVLAVSWTQTLVGVFMAIFSRRFLPDHPLFHAWYWPFLVLSAGVAGVLLLLAKDIRRPRWVRWTLGGIALLQQVAAIAISSAFALPVPMAACSAAVLFVGYAIWVDEPSPDATRYHLIKLHAAAVLILMAGASYLFKAPQELSFEPRWYLLFALAGAVGAYAHLRENGSRLDRIATVLMGSVFAVLSLAALRDSYFAATLYFLPFAAILLFLPLFRHYDLGTDAHLRGADATMIRHFERVSEMVAWAAFLFTYASTYFFPTYYTAFSGALFLLFVGAYMIFTVQYRLLPSRHSDFASLQRKSMVNAVLIAIVSHLTGGLQSPYAWFFILVLIAGSVTPQPRKILDHLGLVLGYYAFETVYSARLGLLNTTIIIDDLLLPVFILSLTGLYAYYLSIRRRQIDEDLLKASASYREAQARETSAEELVVKRTEEVNMAHKRDETLLSSLADGVIAMDSNGLITLVNPVAETILGYLKEEIMGKRLRDLILLKCESDTSFHLSQYLETGLRGNAVPLPDGLYVEGPTGRRIYYNGLILPVLDDEKRPNGAVAVMRDVTYLREVDQMKTSFLSVAAHQLRTPLSTIRWYLELLNDPAEGRLNKDQKVFAEDAYSSLLRMVGLINRLLAITRLEAERVPIRPAPTDLRILTDDILSNAGRKLKEQELDVSVSSPRIMPKVALDPTLAREVLVNLIENAMRYTPKGGKIAIDMHDAGDEIAWSIKDDGIGIPTEQQEKIFEKFYRATNAVDYSSEGSGLGLYLARFIVETWGGKLTFESVEGEGTVFHVTIPKKGMKAKSGQVSLNA